MSKQVVIDLDASQVSYIRCRRDNSFAMTIEFRDKTTGTIEDISSDVFLMEVFDTSGALLLDFTMASGCTVVSNKLYLQKSAAEMSLVAGVHTFGLLRTTAAAIVKTRLHGEFEVVTKYGE